MLACVMRLFSVYGPRERPEKLFMKLINHMVRDKEFPLFEGSLVHKRSFTYVDDIVAGLVAVIDRRKKCIGEVFNIGTGQSTSILEISKMIGGPSIQIADRVGESMETLADISKAKSILKYSPKHKLEDKITSY